MQDRWRSERRAATSVTLSDWFGFVRFWPTKRPTTWAMRIAGWSSIREGCSSRYRNSDQALKLASRSPT